MVIFCPSCMPSGHKRTKIMISPPLLMSSNSQRAHTHALRIVDWEYQPYVDKVKTLIGCRKAYAVLDYIMTNDQNIATIENIELPIIALSPKKRNCSDTG